MPAERGDLDNDVEMRLVVTKRRQYILPISAAVDWEDRYLGRTRPKVLENEPFWRTPDGRVFARMEDESLSS